MTEAVDPHINLARYLIDDLDPDERARFEEHLAACFDCRAALDDLREAGEMAGPPVEPGVGHAAVPSGRAAAIEAGPSSAARGTRKFVYAMNVAILVLAALAVGVALLTRGDDGAKKRAVEAKKVLVDPAGSGQTAVATLYKTSTGRSVELRTDELPKLPPDQLYELWLVGPGDARAKPNRISAGTFRPNGDGHANVDLFAAGDPKAYPVLSVSREPADGDPGWGGPEVLRSRP
jgi:hypothetical protein